MWLYHSVKVPMCFFIYYFYPKWILVDDAVGLRRSFIAVTGFRVDLERFPDADVRVETCLRIL